MNRLRVLLHSITSEQIIFFLSAIAAIIASTYSYQHGWIAAYGDAESHLNIAKRVITSLTPGFAQLGGIWLPLPHMLLIPFVWNDFLWRTGLAGSIVSGACYIVSTLFIYKIAFHLTKNQGAGLCAAFVFASNPNILYMQTTPMTELTLIVFFILSSYYFILFLDTEQFFYIIIAAFFGFLASLSRYDGWGLVLMEASILCLYYFPYTIVWRHMSLVKKDQKKDVAAEFRRLEGRFILYSTLAFFGIVLWLLWDFLILGDPLYFSHSQFSANSQQQSWLTKGELPAYHHMLTSIIYYLYTSVENAGIIIAVLALIGLILFLFSQQHRHKFYVLLVLAVPFIFNVATLYLGQSVIFLPGLTPSTFEWTLFNVRYGIMMIPFIAIFIGYLFYSVNTFGKVVVAILVIIELALFGSHISHVITLDDGVYGLSSGIARVPDAQNYINEHYDYGYVLADDYARTFSIIRSPVPMQDVIYVGNKPYWEDSLAHPETYARWIIMQQNDAVWNAIWNNPATQAELFKYFNKVYTSSNILIFRRISP